jgi:hypothetical protein
MNYTIDKSPYWFSSEQIKKIEETKNAKHMGAWCKKLAYGSWSETPVDVFYVENPDTSKGYTNYFGLFYQNDELYITEASTAFSEPITGILCEDGEVLVSRYRHDFRTKGDVMIDGGRDYLKSSKGTFVNVSVRNGDFLFEKIQEI